MFVSRRDVVGLRSTDAAPTLDGPFQGNMAVALRAVPIHEVPR